MTRDHDTDPNAALGMDAGTNPNYPPLPEGDRSSYGKLNYGPQMRAETDPNFLTPPGGIAATDSDAPSSEDSPPSSDSSGAPISSSGPDSRGELRARHRAPPRKVRPGNNDTVKMVPAVMLNETVPLADAFVAPEVIERRQRNQRKMRRDEATQVNDAGRRKSEKRLLTAAAWGIFAAGLVIVICEDAFK